jgi:hypothetical protein
MTITHRQSGTKLYKTWKSMRERCLNPHNKDWEHYGGRGIGIDDPRWNDFAAFADDMGPHPGKGWTLDRIDNNKGYSKDNCRWATQTTQIRNRNHTKLSPLLAAEIRAKYIYRTNGGTAKLGKDYGVAASTIHRIVIGKLWQ